MLTRLLIAIPLLLAGLALTSFVAPRPTVSASFGTKLPVQAFQGPWDVGKCYRVFPQDRDQFYLFRVVEPPQGGYVRVAAEPPPRLGTGAPPPMPFWLVTGALFGVQEWPCAPEVGR